MTVWLMRIARWYLRLQTPSQNMEHLLLFRSKNGCMNAPQCYVIPSLSVLFKCYIKKHSLSKRIHMFVSLLTSAFFNKPSSHLPLHQEPSNENFSLHVGLISCSFRIHSIEFNKMREVWTILYRDSIVLIAASYELDGPLIKSRLGRDFPHPSRPTMRPPSLLHVAYRMALPEVKWRGVMLTIHSPLENEVKKILELYL